VADAPDQDALAKTQASRDDAEKTLPSRPSQPDRTGGPGPLPSQHVGREEPGRYSMREERGRGGMGRVLIAFDEHLGREVAFKELLGGVDREAAQRFLREARITGQLEHPNIVPVHEVGQSASGALYYTMRLVRGRTLTEALGECWTLAERLRHLGAFWSLCNAVAFAHSRGVVHRDLKPDNVMVGEFGETVLIDWGIARVEKADPHKTAPALLGEEPEPTRAGAVGTPAYMSPEQAAGDPSRVDARSDVWGLGAVLYEILTGGPPFEAATVAATLERVQRGTLAPVRSRSAKAPAELAAVAEKALAKRPEDRYPSAQALAAEVDAYLTGGRVRAYAYSSWELVRHFASRNKAAVLAGTLAFACIVVALVAVSSFWSAERTARQRSDLNLARAYLERAQRHLADTDLDQTRRDAAASLVANPASPLSPGYDASFAAKARSARAAGVEAATTLFQSEARRVLEPDSELPFPGVVGAMAYSGDGKVLAACDQDHGKVRIWDGATRELLREVALPPARPWVLAVSWDAALLARGSETEAVEVFDAKTGALRWAADRSLGSPLSLVFTRQGTLLGSFRVGSPRVFDAATGQVLAAQDGEHGGTAAALTGDGRTMISGTKKGTLQLWSFPELSPLKTVEPNAGALRLTALSPDGRRAVATRGDRTMVTVDLEEGRRGEVLKGHSEAIDEIAFTGDGRRIVSVSADGARLWDAATGQPLMVVRGTNSIRAMAVSPDGATLALGGADEKVKIYRVLREPKTRLFAAQTDRTAFVAFAPDGKCLATGGGGRNPVVNLWDAATLEPLARLAGHTATVTFVAFRPDGMRLASASRDATVRVWDRARAEEVYRIATDDSPEVVAFSPDGSLLAECGTGAAVNLYDAGTGKPLASLTGHKDTIGGLAFSPDGRRLASASNDGTVRLWDVASRRVERVLTGHRAWAWGAAFSPDGRMLATGGKEGEIILWDPQSGTAIKTLVGHRKWVNQVLFAGDGSLVSCSDDGTVRVWDVPSGEERMIFHAPRSVDSVGVSPDGAWLLVGSGTAGELFPAHLPPPALSPQQILARDPLPQEAF
jgi:WD40 repeat protein